MKKLINAAAKLGVKSEVKACGTASMFGCHQVKEPSAVKALKK